MKSKDRLVDDSAAALRELMSAPSDGRATRTRLLAEVAERVHRGQSRRRVGLTLFLALLVVGSASAAFTLGSGWRERSVRTMTLPKGPAAIARTAPPPVVIRTETKAAPDPVDRSRPDEAADYGRAHRAHFVEDSPTRALRAWDEYLHRHPQGTFAPEARFNRALCLIRLGEKVRAAEALRPFAQGEFRGYRRQEACALLGTLTSKPSDCLTDFRP
jgi:hypothetical protein